MDYKGKGKAIEEEEEEGSPDNGRKTPPLEPSPTLTRATPKRKNTDEVCKILGDITIYLHLYSWILAIRPV